MQSTGAENHVHVSEFTYTHIQYDSQFAWTARKTLVKGKGEMDTYLLKRIEKARRNGIAREDKAANRSGPLTPRRRNSAADCSAASKSGFLDTPVADTQRQVSGPSFISRRNSAE